MTSTDTAGQVEARAKAHWEHRRIADFRRTEVRRTEWSRLPEDCRASEIAALPADRLACGGGEHLPPPCYTMSEQHLSGWRVVLGYETLKDAQAAHSFAARQSPAPATQAAGGGVVEALRRLESFVQDEVQGREESGGQMTDSVREAKDALQDVRLLIATLSPASKVQTAGDEQ